MIQSVRIPFLRKCLRGGLVGLLAASAACDGGGPAAAAAPSADSAPGADSTRVPQEDTTALVPPASTPVAPPDSAPAAPPDSQPLPLDSPGAPPPPDSTFEVEEAIAYSGIAFGTFNLENAYFSSVHTGSVRGGGLSPSNIVSLLAGARSRGARVAIKLCNGRDSYVKNSDGTFSLTKWKALVDRFRSVNLGPYIADGTIVGHYLIDEPQNTRKWGGKVISQATVEAMAKYSKGIWPAMPTLVRVVPTWLAGASLTYAYLDAGWAQYASGKGDAAAWVAAEVTAAKRKGLGLVVGLNVLDGGDGSSRIPGYSPGRYAMSAAELRAAGGALLANSYACGFFMWMHDLPFYGRSDIKSAMADLSARARAHAKTSCRQ